jgi:hypothetical protein
MSMSTRVEERRQVGPIIEGKVATRVVETIVDGVTVRWDVQCEQCQVISWYTVPHRAHKVAVIHAATNHPKGKE